MPRFFVGDKIRFAEEKTRYTVKACDDRFLICTKPYNPGRTVIYTIVDFVRGIRGTENLVFCEGFETDEQCAEALVRLQKAETEVSHRNHIPLNIKLDTAARSQRT